MSPRARTGLAATCFLVAVLGGAASLLGVFARGTGAFISVTTVRGDVYDMATTGVYAYNAQRVVAEGVGWDIVTLVLAVPALLLAVPLVARGSFRGRLFAAGLLGYFLYQYLEYSVTWAFGPLFLLFVAIYGASLVGIAWIGWSLATDKVTEPFGDRFPRRGWAALDLGMAVLLTMMWLARIGASMGGDTSSLNGETTFTVQALDLGLLVPASVLTALLVLRRSRLGYALAATFGVTFAAMTAAITGMLLSAWAVEGNLEIVPVAIFGIASVLALGLLVRTYRMPRTGTRQRADVRAVGASAG
ncbi:MAG TPA: hypothetical protein VF323_04335 [Candidatus Limnocylindrales bacterium]